MYAGAATHTQKKEQFNSSWTLTATFHFHIWSQRSVQSSLTVEFQKATEVGSAWGEEASLSSSLQRYACSKSCARNRGWKWWWGVVFSFFSLKNKTKKTLVIASASCGSLDALTNKKNQLAEPCRNTRVKHTHTHTWHDTPCLITAQPDSWTALLKQIPSV